MARERRIKDPQICMPKNKAAMINVEAQQTYGWSGTCDVGRIATAPFSLSRQRRRVAVTADCPTRQSDKMPWPVIENFVDAEGFLKGGGKRRRMAGSQYV